jgi:hypothetical protein
MALTSSMLCDISIWSKHAFILNNSETWHNSTHINSWLSLHSKILPAIKRQAFSHQARHRGDVGSRSPSSVDGFCYGFHCRCMASENGLVEGGFVLSNRGTASLAMFRKRARGVEECDGRLKQSRMRQLPSGQGQTETKTKCGWPKPIAKAKATKVVETK